MRRLSMSIQPKLSGKTLSKNKTLLITGAFGLVGSNICKALQRDCPDIVITKVKHLDNLLLPDIKYDYIIHAMGYGQPLKFSEDKIETIKGNTCWTEYLFKHLKQEGTFLFISSSEVYSGAKSPYTEDMIGTTTPQHERACYIESKRCGEAILMAHKDEFNVKIARLALAYGPGTKRGDTRVLNQFIEQALTTGKIVMKDKGEAKRTYAYIDDVVNQLLSILFKSKEIVYNVGGISETTIRSMAETIAAITKAKVVVGDKGLKGAPKSVKLDLSRIENEFGLKYTPFEFGLSKTINYQRELYE